MHPRQIKTALISVFHKEHLDEIVKILHQQGVKIISTGGTQQFIESLNIPVVPVEKLTGYPSILGGRVKTLHPKIFGGILGRADEIEDVNEMAAFEIESIDLVIVDLYPFEATLASDASHEEIIEKVDIGGISLIRAAAKNYNQTLIIPSQEQYAHLHTILTEGKGISTLDDRKTMAAYAFSVSAHYDSAIFNYFNRDQKISVLRSSYNTHSTLRYGENPHQQASFFGDLNQLFDQINGKTLSYNNLLDVDAAVNLIADFNEPTFVVIKHNNACGCASRSNVFDAWSAALAGDPVSAFGGILATNTEIDLETATEIDKIFYEVLIAPSINADALALLTKKKNRIILIQKAALTVQNQYRSILNGVMLQEKDLKVETQADLKVVTRKALDNSSIEDVLFALKLVKHTKSNAIILAKNKQLIGSGTGQTSRIDAMKQAVHKARSFNFEVKGAVLASDAFFPFADSVETAFNEGITNIVQPGGSIKDQDSIDFCDQHDMAMVFTGFRHFKH